MPGTRIRAPGSAWRACACPAIVSWSVSATTSRPACAARRITSAGGSVPSEALLWTCRSARIGGPGRGGGSGRRQRGEGAPKGRSRSMPGSRRSRSPIGSISRVPAVSGQSTTHSQWPLISPANTARSGESTCHSGKSCLPNDAVATGGADPKPAPGSTPSRPASAAPKPVPGSSATTSMSAGPPSGFGPDSATAQARMPVRSSPAPAKPVTSQPTGSGQGSQAGTPAVRSSPSRPSRDGLKAGSKG